MVLRHRILVPVSLNANRLGVIHLGRYLSSRFAEVTLLHVIKTPQLNGEFSYSESNLGNGLPIDRVVDKLMRLRDIRDREMSDLEQVNLEVVVDNYPAEVICEKALCHSIDMIIMNTYANNDAYSSSMGTITEEVLKHSPCPVLLLHPTEENKILDPVIRKPRIGYMHKREPLYSASIPKSQPIAC